MNVFLFIFLTIYLFLYFFFYVIQVILKNEMTKEYQWWDLHYEAVDDDEPADDIILSTRVRQKLEYSIELDNPSEESTVFTANTSHPDVTVQENLTVPGKKKVGRSFSSVLINAN